MDERSVASAEEAAAEARLIFAKLDVCFWRHKRFVRAGPAACGLWAAALAYLREDDSRDGVVDGDVVGQLLDLGEREARKLCERLVDVGLFERRGEGYVLLRYAAKNETREEIEARRSATRSRVAAFREKRRQGAHSATSNADGNTNGNALHVSDVTSLVTRNSSVSVPGSGSDSDSLSGSDLFLGREHERNPEPPVANVRSVGPPAEADRYLDPDEQLTPELAEVARFPGCEVQDVVSAWRKFCGTNAGRWINVRGKWQAWCTSWAKNERKERDQQSAVRLRKAPLTGPEGNPNPVSRSDEPSEEEVQAHIRRAREEVARAAKAEGK